MSDFRLKPADVFDYLVYLVYRGVGWALGCLPLHWVFGLGQFIGWLGYLLLGSYRRLAMANIRIAFPDWSHEEVKRCSQAPF